MKGFRFGWLISGLLGSCLFAGPPQDGCCATGGMLDQLCPGMGTVSVSAEALYWKPSFGGFDYAAVKTTDCSSVKTLKSDYDWGVWLGLTYLTPSECNFLQLSGLFIDFSDHQQIRTDGELQDAFGQLVGGDFAAARLKIDYWWIDLRWAHYLSRGCGIEFYTYSGVRVAQFATRFRIDSEGQGTTQQRGGFGRTKADLRGVGPEVGVGGEYCLWGDFTLFGNAGMTALVSRRTYRQDTFNNDHPDIISRLRYSRLWGAVPALDAKLGLAFTYRCGGCFFRGQIGYTLDYYWNVNKVRLPFTGQGSVGNASFERADRDLGFGGAFFGLTVGF